MNVNEKGVKGLIKVIDDLQEKGYYCFPAFDDHCPVDLIAIDKNGQTYRLQIKYRSKLPDKNYERYFLPADSVVCGKRIPIDRNMIDGWAVYLEERKKVVYINKNLLMNKKSLTINPDINYGEMGEWFKPADC